MTTESPTGETPAASPSPLGQDRLLTLILPEVGVRLVLVDASATAFEAEFRHLCGRCSAEVTARAIVGNVLLGADLKGDERLSIQLTSNGPVGGFLTEVDADLRVRGYPTRKVMRKLDVGTMKYSEALGTEGRMVLLRSTAAGVVYQGVTELAERDIATDLERHLRESQQIPSVLCIDHGYGRQLTHAVGFLMQALPGVEEVAFDELARQIRGRVGAARPFDRTLERLVEKVLPPDVTYQVLGERAPRFQCRCSRERVVSTLRSIGPPDDGQGYPEISRVTCAFCNDTYEIPSAEIDAAGGAGRPASSG